MNDELIEAYKQHVDRTLIRENLRLTPQQRSEKFERAMALVFELKRVAEERRKSRIAKTNSSDANSPGANSLE